MQTGVENEVRGEINSVEFATTQLATMLTYVAGMLLNDPRYFVWLVIASSLAVSVSAVLFTVWARIKVRLWLFCWCSRHSQYSHRALRTKRTRKHATCPTSSTAATWPAWML